MLPSHDIVNCVYVTTEPDSPLRRLMGDMCVWYGNEGALGGDTDETDREFFIDLARALFKELGKTKSNGGPTRADVSICDYHKPGDCGSCTGRKRRRTD